jgi:hypothetical protein
MTCSNRFCTRLVAEDASLGHMSFVALPRTVPTLNNQDLPEGGCALHQRVERVSTYETASRLRKRRGVHPLTTSPRTV